MHIGRNILHVRTIKLLKQSEMAHRLDITQQAYSRIENSDTIGAVTLTRVAKALGVEVSFLTSLDEDKLIDSMSGNHSTNIQIVLNFEINSNENYSLPDLTELTRNIEDFARRATNDRQNNGHSGSTSV